MKAERVLGGYYSALINIRGSKDIPSAEHSWDIADNLLATQKERDAGPHFEDHCQSGIFVRTLVASWASWTGVPVQL